MKFSLMNSASLVKMDVLRGDLRLQEKEKKLVVAAEEEEAVSEVQEVAEVTEVTEAREVEAE